MPPKRTGFLRPSVRLGPPLKRNVPLQPSPFGFGWGDLVFHPKKMGEKSIATQGENLRGRRVKKLGEGVGPSLHLSRLLLEEERDVPQIG